MIEPFSVLIPERGRPDLLDRTLAHLHAALDEVDAESETRVLVNGAPQSVYRDLTIRYPRVLWFFSRRALGFHRAMARLVSEARYGWVYLLNSDMRLDAAALARVLPWRAPDIFAIASQIEFADTLRRREETGYTVPVIDDTGQLALHDVLPPDEYVRGNLYAGGGASLFQRPALQRYLARSKAYAPFYFEDADWAMQAWSEGLSVLFCPTSRAVHEHRGTIGRFVPAPTIDRIVERNLGYFRWRYGDYFRAQRAQLSRRFAWSFWMTPIGREHRNARKHLSEAPYLPDFRNVHRKRYPHLPRFRQGKPRALLISPFSILPPAHGGARRIVELARASAQQIDWVLLHDEAEGADLRATVDDKWFREVHPIGGRPEHGPEPLERSAAHAHPAFAQEVQRLISSLNIDVVCMEHIETVGLIPAVPDHVPIVLSLHDAGRALPDVLAQSLRRRLPRISALVVSTEKDLGYWGHRREVLVENGARVPDTVPQRSPARGDLLCIAPLRYAPNLRGVQQFLSQVWPKLHTRYPDLRLNILGGIGSLTFCKDVTLPDGVALIDGYLDPTDWYARSALCINPQTEIEGSAIKVAEALAHARVIVSTETGARGYEALDTPALRQVSQVPDMLKPLVELLDEPEHRWQHEQAAISAIAPWSWSRRAEPLIELVRSLMDDSLIT